MKDFVGRYLVLLCLVCFRRPFLALALLGLSFAGSLAYGALNLRLELAWTHLFEADDPVVTEFEKARSEFPFPGDIAVLVDHGSRAERERYLDSVAAEMAKEPDVFFHVFYRLEIQELGRRALYFLPSEMLASLRATLRDSPLSGEETRPSDTAVRLQLSLLEDLKQALLSRGRTQPAPLWEAFSPERDQRLSDLLSSLLHGRPQVYATLAEGEVNVLIFKGGTRGAELSSRGDEVKAARALLERLQATAHGLRVRLTGLPVMLYDERQTCAQDSLRSGLISLLLIFLVFCLGFGGLRKPLYCMAGLVCGLGWTAAYAALSVGHLNFITVTTVSMLMGLGIDFGIHFLFRFEEELASGLEQERALRQTVLTTGVDTLVGAAATSAAFAALIFTDFRGVSDLGVLASGGVLLCYFSTVSVLSALLRLSPRQAPRRHALLGGLAGLEAGLLRRHRWVLGLTTLLFVLALLLAARVGFSYNLLAVQAQELDSVRTEKEMLREYKTTVLSGAVLCDGPAQAREMAERLSGLDSVAQVGTITKLVPAVSDAKQALVSDIVREAQALQAPTPIALDRAQDLIALRKRVKELEKERAAKHRDPKVETALDDLKSVAGSMPLGPLQDGLRSFQASFLGDFTKLCDLLRSQVAQPVTLADLPEELVLRSVSPQGRYLLTVQPGIDIWQRENLERFLLEVRSTGANLVGHPVVQAHILGAFDRTFQVTPWYTLLGVMAVMLLYLRRPGQVLLSALPTALGVVFILATMGLVGMDFNVVNFVALPISVGIGAVYGVHALHRMQEMGSEMLLNTSTGYGILLSGLTTIAGFASLMTAQHQGLRSFGFVISVGVLANLLVSLLVLPALCRWRRELS